MNNIGKIPVMEVFGPTIQGEGMVIGRKTMFIRTAGCDYRCVWCDSPFTWNGTEKDCTTWLLPSEIIALLRERGGNRFNHVTVSGGNPALLGAPVATLIDLCHQLKWQVGLETQGSHWQPWFLEIDDLTISPKPPSSKMDTDFAILDGVVKQLAEHNVNFSLKIVIFDEGDLAYAKKVFQRYPTASQYLQVGNDATGETGSIATYLLGRLNWLFEQVIQDPTLNNAKVLPQLHALVWGNERER